jgi:hypothetical protein
MNSSVAPQLIAKNQAAFLLNATVRGAFAKTRPPFQVLTIVYGGDTVLQNIVEQGLFQGAGYYRPDFGAQVLIAQIQGVLVKFTEQDNGTWLAQDISVPGDPNNPSVSQVWMWQAEKWMIVADGTSANLIFYDGTTSRRSYGPSVILGTIDTDFTVPEVGEVVTVHLSAPWTGPFNVPVIVDGEFYQTAGGGGSGGFSAILTNVNDTPGATIPSSSQITVHAATIGYVASVVGGSSGFGFLYVDVIMSSVDGLRPGLFIPPNLVGDHGDLCSVPVSQNGNPATSRSMYAVSVNAATKAVRFQLAASTSGSLSIAANAVVNIQGSSAPNVIVATTTAAYTVPAIGADVTVFIDTEYSGTPNQLVWVGSKQYTIQAAPPPGPSDSLDLINLTANPGDTVVATQDIFSVPELPSGRMGAYGLGQNWLCLTDGISFIVSDPVGGASGTPANNYRDAVLKYTELTFRGGSFRLPTSGVIINSMTFTTTLDTSLGQGPMEIGTESGMYSCIAPVNFTDLPNITGPILTVSLLGDGPQGQYSTIAVNSDIIFRSIVGLGSLILARREFITWGNTPISQEMQRIFDADDRSLLQFSSAIQTSNRHLVTAKPQTGQQGVFSSGLVVMNLDPLSSLRGKAQSVYDGAWSGINILQLVQGKIGSEQRAFAFTFNVTDSKIELYELLSNGVADNGVTPIKMVIETAVLFNQDTKPLNQLIRLDNAELFLSDIVGNVHIKVSYRPDYYPCFVPWREWDECQTAVATDAKPGYRTRLGLGEPSGTPCQEGNERQMRVGHFFQFRIELTGKCTFKAFRVRAIRPPMRKQDC